MGILTFMVLVVGFFFLMHSTAFQIQDIRLPDTHSIAQSDVQRHVEEFFAKQSAFTTWLFGNRNIFALKSEKLSASLLETFPPIKDVQIEKGIRDRSLSINITEREKFGLWCATSCVWFDENGIAFQDGLQTEGNLIYRIHDLSGKAVQLGTHIFPEYGLQNLFHIYDFLEQINWTTKTLILENEILEELRTPSIQGSPVIYFNLTNNPLYAVDSVRDIQTSVTEYIDLRVESRIYYK